MHHALLVLDKILQRVKAAIFHECAKSQNLAQLRHTFASHKKINPSVVYRIGASNHDPFYFIERNFIAAPIIELRGGRIRMASRGLHIL